MLYITPFVTLKMPSSLARSLPYLAHQTNSGIVTDGSQKSTGIGATLYISREGQVKLSGFYSAKLKKHQSMWLPCEIEALSIAATIKHYSPYMIQAFHPVCLLTDSKPCVQAHDKLCRGEFSPSSRVTTFLSIISRYQVSIRHLAGSAYTPSDFSSLKAPDCIKFHYCGKTP